ncbi:MAG: hypothetical protein NTX85_02855 [Candidatus Nomurabacteria bacterium]|nr:hypothetical protein [Candidatus Nomurabacteria bacterium]
MEIIKKDIQLCSKCDNYRGIVEERYNGKVPVHCACDLELERINYGKWRSPCMISPNGDKLWWTPISEHKHADGRWYHTASFAGPKLNRK